MTIQELGSLGELVAAIATAATLFYLALQIRQGNAAARTAGRRTIINTFYEATWSLATTPELRRIVMRGFTNLDDLGNEERVAFDSFMTRYVGNVYDALCLREGGTLDDESFHMIAGTFVSAIRDEGGRQWWESGKHLPQIPPIARQYIDDRLRDTASLPDPILHAMPHWRPKVD